MQPGLSRNMELGHPLAGQAATIGTNANRRRAGRRFETQNQKTRLHKPCLIGLNCGRTPAGKLPRLQVRLRPSRL